MLKLILALGFIGHIICGCTDVLLGYSKSGRINLKEAIKDNEKMSAAFADYPINNSLASMLLGVCAIVMFTFGYLELSEWMEGFSPVSSKIMYISAVASMIVMVAHHVFCGTVCWFYVRMGRTSEAKDAVMDFFKKTISTMIVGYLLYAVFLVTFFVTVVSGNTVLPQWACVFNALIVMAVLAPTKLPAKGNISGAVMFLGLLFLM